MCRPVPLTPELIGTVSWMTLMVPILMVPVLMVPVLMVPVLMVPVLIAITMAVAPL